MQCPTILKQHPHMSFRKIILTSLLWFCGAATASTEGVPALRVTAPNGQSSIMIGTLHVPYQGLIQPAADLLNGRKRLIVEGSATQGPQPPPPSFAELIHPDAIRSMLAGHGFSRAPWASNLTDEQTNQLLSAARCGRPSFTREEIEQILSFKTAEIASGLAYLRCGPGLGLSRDQILNQAAVARGIQIDILETQVDVDRQRKAVPPSHYASVLATAFAPDVEIGFQTVVEGLNKGDYASVLAASQRNTANPADAEAFTRLMLTERNEAWIAPLRRYLDEGNAVVAVGAGHFAGQQGLIALLRRQGYLVEPIFVQAQ